MKKISLIFSLLPPRTTLVLELDEMWKPYIANKKNKLWITYQRPPIPNLYPLIVEIPSETQHFRVKVSRVCPYEVGFHAVLGVYTGVLGLAFVWAMETIGFLSSVQPNLRY